MTKEVGFFYAYNVFEACTNEVPDSKKKVKFVIIVSQLVTLVLREEHNKHMFPIMVTETRVWVHRVLDLR